MIDPETYEAHLIDFGLCTFFEKKKQREVPTSDFCGSLEYICPEAFLGSSYRSTLADSWALGIVTYTLLFGQFPFSVEDIVKGKGHPYPPHVLSVPLPGDLSGMTSSL